MQVELVDYTKNALTNIVTAARGCYGNGNTNKSDEENIRLVKALISSDHTPIEFGWVMFRISGISRACCDQLTRYRLASHCVSGDTLLKTSSQKTNNRTIKDLYSMKKQYLDMVCVRCIDPTTKKIGYEKIEKIIPIGVKDVYEVTTEKGYKIKTTIDHQFLSDTGWVPLSSLSSGSTIFVNGEQLYKNKDWLKRNYIDEQKTLRELSEICGISTHTIRVWLKKYNLQQNPWLRKSAKTPHNKGKTKLDYEPLMKVSSKMRGKKPKYIRYGEEHAAWKGDNIEVSSGYSRVARSYVRKNVCSLCGFCGPTEIHHKDKNPRNFSKDNLLELCVACHKAIHRREYSLCAIKDTIKSIKYAGQDEVFDICMKGEYHNFVGNGFVLHNCVQSQRYVNIKDAVFNHPVKALKAAGKKVKEMEKAQKELYQELIEAGVKKEDARAYIGIGFTTELCIACNLREIRHILHQRLDVHAQLEVRTVAVEIYNKIKNVFPWLVEDLEPLYSEAVKRNKEELS